MKKERGCVETSERGCGVKVSESLSPHVRSKTMFYPCTRSSLHNRTATVVDLSHVTVRIAVTASFGSATIPVVGDVGSILPLALCLVKL